MSWFGNKDSGPQSNAEATTKALKDVNSGSGMANTAGWNGSARQAYETTFKHQQEQNEKRRTGG